MNGTLNFREAYRGRYQNIAPDARLLAETEELLCERLHRPQTVMRPFAGVLRFGRGAAVAVGLCLALVAVSPQLMGLLDGSAGGAADTQSAQQTFSVTRMAENTDGDGPDNAVPAAGDDNDREADSAASAADSAAHQESVQQPVSSAAGVPGLLGTRRTDGQPAQEKGQQDIVPDDIVQSDIAVCMLPAAPLAQELTEAELYAQAGYAGLLPVELPQGYVLESASLIEDETGAVLHVIWTHGYDYIRVQIRPLTEADAGRLVDIERPETWDPEYYAGMLTEDQPLSDRWRLVPEELFDAVHYPIFARGDFTAEVLHKRCSPSDDEGHYYGQFGLAFDGMLADYTVRSDDLAAVFAAVSSAEAF